MADNVSIDESTAASPTKVDSDETTKDGVTIKRQRVATAPTTAVSVLSTVAGSASSVTVLAANTDRVRCVVVNDSSAILYLKEGTTASTSSFTYKLSAGDTVIIDDYTGKLDGIWASATGNARVTELS